MEIGGPQPQFLNFFSIANSTPTMEKVGPGSSHLNFTLGGLLIGGGIFGYARAKSVPSLAAGVALGGAFIAAGVTTATKPFQGHVLALVASVITTAAMGSRLYRTHKVMPAGVVLGLGVIGLLYNGRKAKLEYDLL